MKLTIQHLAPYIPYGLKGRFRVGDVMPHLIEVADEYREKELKISNIEFFFNHCKPILHPLSDLTKEIEHNGEVKPIVIALADVCFDNNFSGELVAKVMIDLKPSTRHEILKTMPYFIIEQLISWHFDVFGLIEQGLAIDINTFNK